MRERVHAWSLLCVPVSVASKLQSVFMHVLHERVPLCKAPGVVESVPSVGVGVRALGSGALSVCVCEKERDVSVANRGRPHW